MIRLGRISYVNMAPVFFRVEAEVDEVQGVPTALNTALLEGELDVAPISSIEYARNASHLRLLARLCVASEGAVDSIQLVSRTPLERVRTVAVTPESATSVVLTKVLLPDADHVPLGEDAEAKLLIGDAALKSAFEDPTPHLRPRPALAGAHRAADGVRGLGRAEPHPGLPGARGSARLLGSRRARRAGAARLRVVGALRLSGGLPRPLLREAPLQLRPRERAGLYAFLELARDVGELEVPSSASSRAPKPPCEG